MKKEIELCEDLLIESIENHYDKDVIKHAKKIPEFITDCMIKAIRSVHKR